MAVTVADGLTGAFKDGANETAYRLALWRHQDRLDRERRQKEQRIDRADSDVLDLASTIITSEQATTFRHQIDAHQIATVEALDANRAAMEATREELDRILSRAYRLDDGRRIFKTLDGQTVFDEFGTEISTDIIPPDDIPDHAPRWETAKAVMDELERLEAEQTELIEYQNDLDQAHELLDSGHMTQEQFDQLRETLFVNAPESVKARMDGPAADSQAHTPPSDLAAGIDLDTQLSSMPMPKLAPPGR